MDFGIHRDPENNLLQILRDNYVKFLERKKLYVDFLAVWGLVATILTLFKAQLYSLLHIFLLAVTKHLFSGPLKNGPYLFLVIFFFHLFLSFLI